MQAALQGKMVAKDDIKITESREYTVRIVEGSIFMRKASLLLLVTFLLLPVSSFAQNAEYSPFEVFGGYSFMRSGGISEAQCPTIIGSCIFGFGGEHAKNMNGWNMAFTGNLYPTIGVKAEVSGFYSKLNEEVWGDFNAAGYSFMVGPQIRERSHGRRDKLFGHVLFGFERYTVSREPRNAGNSESKNSFAMAFGGGIDWHMGNWAIRAPQVDYFPWIHSYGILSNVRISTGIVFKIKNNLKR